MRLRAHEPPKSATPTVVGVALVFWALHAFTGLVLAIGSRGCPDECHAFALAAVFSTSLLGSVVLICAGLAAWRWRQGDREAARSRGLFVACSVVGVTLLVAALLALTGVLEGLIEGVLGMSLQPTGWEDYGSYDPPSGVTVFEVVAAAYAAGVGAIAVAGAVWMSGRARRATPR